MTTRIVAVAAVALVLAACASQPVAMRTGVAAPDAPRELAGEGPVTVAWSDPAQFSELRFSANPSEAARGDWVAELARHLRQRATQRLAPGERLHIVITDIQRAGNFEPWRGVDYHDTRIVRDLYPPRIALRFERRGADGAVVASGERALSDPGYLDRTGLATNTDPLRHEKALLDRWLAQELSAAP